MHSGTQSIDGCSCPVADASRPLRVLHVIDSLALGGAQRLALDLIAALLDRGVACRLVALADGSGTYPGFSLPVEPTYLGFHGDYRRPFSTWSCAKRLRTIVGEWSADIVHSHLWLSDYLAALATRGTGARHIVHIVDRRGWQASPRLRHRLRRWATRRAFRAAGSRFLSVSLSAKEYACENLGLDPRSVRVAFNGIDVSRFSAIAQDHPRLREAAVIGAAGRLEEEKGHAFLFEAIAMLAQRGRDVRLAMTGDGPNRQCLAQMAERLGIASRVSFLGRVDDMAAFYRDLDVFVMPSIHSEGLPTAILEAMASRLPIVVTDVGGAVEAIRDGIEGIVVSAKNGGELADAIAALLADPARAHAMAHSARTRAETLFDLPAMARSVLEAYCALGRGW